MEHKVETQTVEVSCGYEITAYCSGCGAHHERLISHQAARDGGVLTSEEHEVRDIVEGACKENDEAVRKESPGHEISIETTNSSLTFYITASCPTCGTQDKRNIPVKDARGAGVVRELRDQMIRGLQKKCTPDEIVEPEVQDTEHKELPILCSVIDHYGPAAQTVKAIEELTELSMALQHHAAGKATRQDVVEEVADVQIMLMQLMVINNITDAELDEVMKLKVERTQGRIDKDLAAKTAKEDATERVVE